MLIALGWWVLIELVGLAALPLTARILRFLPGRGLALSKQVGLLIGVYLFWLLGVLHVAGISAATAWFCVLVVAGLSIVVMRRHRDDLRAMWREAKPIWLMGEIVFGLAFVAFCIFRAYNPEISATEKPMELAFTNGILRSDYFPPRDPWLSGYAISYYYGGYALTAMLTLLLGASTAFTFNLTNATLFALTASGAFALLAELVSGRERHVGAPARRQVRRALLTGLLGAVLVAAMGNLEGIFELLRAHGGGSEALWAWLDVRNLGASAPSAHWYPDDGWWWWRASRIIHDRDLAGNASEVISEFPFFSFLLGDNHPHVYALPFGLLALALSYNLLLACRQGAETLRHRLGGFVGTLQATVEGVVPGAGLADWLAWVVLLGALGWFNTWDLPIHLLLFFCAGALGLWSRRTQFGTWAIQVLTLGVLLVSGCLLLYAPFYWALRSQAGGLGLVTVKTQWQQYGLMFGAFLWPLFGAATVAVWRGLRRGSFLGRAWLTLLAAVALAAGAQGWWTVCIGLFLAALAGYLVLERDALRGDAPAGDAFVWLLVVAGSLLTVLVEFVYLRDVFDTRMNTIFKFYYQAWLLLGVAAAYALYRLATLPKTVLQRLAASVWLTVSALLILAGLSYTVAAGVSKAGGFAGTPTLDGERYIAAWYPQRYEAMRWLDEHAERGAIMIEATGGSYSEYNWVSAHTGIPTPLGWKGHEGQWRGNYDVAGKREPAIETFYQSMDVDTLRDLAATYEIDYVWLGPLERSRYAVSPATEAALGRAFTQVFANDDVIIYATASAQWQTQATLGE